MENKKEITVTRAEKKELVKNLVKEVLTKTDYKHNDLIEEVANLYVERFEKDADNINDVKGRVGSVIDIMKKEQEVAFDGGVYALNVKKAEQPIPDQAEKQTKKKTAKKAAKTEETATQTEEKPKKATRTKKTKTIEEPSLAGKAETEDKKESEGTPMPTPPFQPIAPVAPITPDVAPEPVPEKKPARRTKKKAQAEEKIEQAKADTPVETPFAPVAEEVKAEEIPTSISVAEEPKKEDEPKQTALLEVKKGEVAQKNTVMDMSFLFGAPKAAKTEQKSQEKKEEPVKETVKEEKTETNSEIKTEGKAEIKAEEKKEEKREERKEYPTRQPRPQQQASQTKQQSTGSRKIQLKKTVKVLTGEEKLKEAFLRKIRSLGGDYFEYYSVYLLEKYSRQNGRRLEGLRITAGDHDGGIDGEIELTDRLGFRETIYIQSKNWNPEKGDERLWVVGETLLQQFIGACACRQAKDGKQHCRGIFITTSRFTPEAKRILESMSDKIVGYDGDDLFETAKECSFGLIKKNGEWALDEGLLSGEKAFFSML